MEYRNIKANASIGFIGRHAIWALLLISCAVFGAMNSHFLTLFNLSDILLQTAFLGLLAVGLTPIMINGNIDLSIGATLGLSACLVVGLQSHGLVASVLVAIVTGAALGLLNGWLVEKAGINSFVVTLAAMIGVRGLAFVYAGDGTISASDPRFVDLGTMNFGPIQITVIVFAVLAVVFHWMLSKTIHGRNAYAIGGNRSAAVNAGVAVPSHVIINFAICGAMASLCGIAMAAQLGSATPSFGSGYELWAITAVVLGGTALKGGRGGVVGTLGGALTLAVLRNGMDIVQIQPFYAQVILGAVLIAAIAVNRGVNQPLHAG
ncbi:ABC transporter permease [Paraburkholderia sacchari]|uniref:ABC transporter permease n=1 Tax=Paraburkholderia sacchari TaxID=159450 RepID=UPI0039A4E5F3